MIILLCLGFKVPKQTSLNPCQAEKGFGWRSVRLRRVRNGSSRHCHLEMFEEGGRVRQTEEGGVIKGNQDISSGIPTGLGSAILPDWREGFVWRGGQDHRCLVKEKFCPEEWRELTPSWGIHAGTSEGNKALMFEGQFSVCVQKKKNPGSPSELSRIRRPRWPPPLRAPKARIAALAFGALMHDRCTSTRLSLHLFPLFPSGAASFHLDSMCSCWWASETAVQLRKRRLWCCLKGRALLKIQCCWQ